MDLFEELITHKDNLDTFAEKLPCMLHVNDPNDFHLVYIDPYSRRYGGVDDFEGPLRDFDNLATVHPDDLEEAVASCRHYLANAKALGTVSFLQRIKIKQDDYRPFFTTSKLIEALGGLVSFSMALDGGALPGRPINQIIEETYFIRSSFQKFGLITEKEKHLIRLWVRNYDNLAIARRMGITAQTVKTYKKRVYNKLEINSYQELYRYASSFDLAF